MKFSGSDTAMGWSARAVNPGALPEVSLMTSRTEPDPVVHILLATYNGARFVEAQIASIQAQTYSSWRMLVRDDGSTDDTLERVATLAQADDRIEILRDDHPSHLGACANFGILLDSAVSQGAVYVCFSDQDDVWAPDKLDQQLRQIQGIEAREGPGHPVLIYADPELVDSRLDPISPSFYAYQGIAQGDGEVPLSCLLVQNHVVGCTTLINGPLIALAAPIPPGVFMHDWWIALCASACGSTRRVGDGLVRYRQHGGNEVGAGGWRRVRDVSSFRRTLNKMNRIFLASLRQAQLLEDRIRRPVGLGSQAPPALQPGTLSLVRDWGRMPGLGLTARLALARRRRLRSQNPILTVLLYLQVIALPAIRSWYRQTDGYRPESNE